MKYSKQGAHSSMNPGLLRMIMLKRCSFQKESSVTSPIQLFFPPKPGLMFQAAPVPCCPGGFVCSQWLWVTQGCQAGSLSPVVTELMEMWQVLQT